MTRLSYASASFDAVVAFYSIIHVLRAEHPDLLHAIATRLKPGGLFVATMGATDVEAQFSPNW
jgi:2-polyprenyl-3-methyl-5-hydroxy-6-metoxy-1,4-benzoquinol methylase